MWSHCFIYFFKKWGSGVDGNDPVQTFATQCNFKTHIISSELASRCPQSTLKQVKKFYLLESRSDIALFPLITQVLQVSDAFPQQSILLWFLTSPVMIRPLSAPLIWRAGVDYKNTHTDTVQHSGPGQDDWILLKVGLIFQQRTPLHSQIRVTHVLGYIY